MSKKKIAYIGAGPATLYSIQTLLKLGEYDVVSVNRSVVPSKSP